MDAVAPDEQLAGRYVLREQIATGGMATVWRAHDEVLARTVAIKILLPDLARDSGFLERFRLEAVSAARLTHPCIVSVYDTGVDGSVCYIVMEDMGGPTLREVFDQEGPLGAERAVELMLPVLSALGFAHENGLVHRDVKPGNVLVGADGRVKVTDFGIARAAFAARDLTTTGQVLGTVRYLAPEQVQGSELDGRSDLYSAGVVLYEAVTGRVPFEADNDVATGMMRLTNDPIPPRSVRPGIPKALEAVILRAMARHPDARFPSAEAMQAALSRLVSGGPPTVAVPAADSVPEREAPSPSVFRSWMLLPLIVLALAAILITTGLLMGRLGLGGPFDQTEAEGSPTPTAPPAMPIDPQAARDFDPEGDGSESPSEVSAAIDGDPSTAWETEGYNSALLGGLKDGVGLWLDLGGEVQVTRVEVSSPLPGWTFELRAGPYGSPSEPLSGVGGRRAFTVGANGRAAIDLDPVMSEGLLIWIIEMAPDGGRYRASVGDVTVLGAAG
jgi:eukaryotic-like serine/threonine-protein kinase